MISIKLIKIQKTSLKFRKMKFQKPNNFYKSKLKWFKKDRNRKNLNCKLSNSKLELFKLKLKLQKSY